MTKIVDAIYAHGQFQPVESVELPEQQRVRLIIQTIDGRQPEDRASALRRLLEGLQASTLHYGGPLPSRDELHDRS